MNAREFSVSCRVQILGLGLGFSVQDFGFGFGFRVCRVMGHQGLAWEGLWGICGGCKWGSYRVYG